MKAYASHINRLVVYAHPCFAREIGLEIVLGIMRGNNACRRADKPMVCGPECGTLPDQFSEDESPCPTCQVTFWQSFP